MGKDRIRVWNDRGETLVEVDHWPHPSARTSVSSCQKRPVVLSGDRWREAAKTAERQRLRNNGLIKGRILYLFDVLPLRHYDEVVAYLSFSIPKGRVTIRRFEIATDVTELDGHGYKALLTECLQDVAEANRRRGGSLFWETEHAWQEDEAADSGFTRVKSIFRRISGRQALWERKLP